MSIDKLISELDDLNYRASNILKEATQHFKEDEEVIEAIRELEKQDFNIMDLYRIKKRRQS